MPALRMPRIHRAELLDAARRRTGLSDFGEWPFDEGLERLVQACADEGRLSLFGYFATRWDIRRLLSNLLRLRYEELRQPAILSEPIERPIFITGLPRTGTTFLHQLLSLDVGNRFPSVWQTLHPYPDPGARRDRRERRVDRQLSMFALMNPDFRRMHPVRAGSPQECSEITAHVFASLRFDTTYTIPAYRAWLDNAGHTNAYRFHKRFLQHLQAQQSQRGRWVLKCPDHVFAFDAIREVYPDARWVFVHRDPLRVIPSVARLTEVLRRPFTHRLDRVALGRQECERWILGAELLMQTADREPFADPIFHVCYRDLVQNPLATLQGLYRHFGLTLTSGTAARVGQFVQAVPNGGYIPNHHPVEAFGIDRNALNERFSAYIDRFGVVRERDPGKPGRAPALLKQAEQAHPAS